MANTLTWRSTLLFGANGINKELTINADAVQMIDDAGLADATQTQYALVLDVSQLVAFSILCDKDATLKTNSSGSPAQTLTLKAGHPFAWEKDSGITNPLTTDVTTIFVTQSSGATARFQLIAVVDPTL